MRKFRKTTGRWEFELDLVQTDKRSVSHNEDSSSFNGGNLGGGHNDAQRSLAI